MVTTEFSDPKMFESGMKPLYILVNGMTYLSRWYKPVAVTMISHYILNFKG